MNKRVGIVPWLMAAMMVVWGGVQAHAEEAAPLAAPTIAIDKTELSNGGTIKVTGQAPAGKPVYLEVWATDHNVRANRFDSDVDKIGRASCRERVLTDV